MSFSCACGSTYFYGSKIQGGQYMDTSHWVVVWCLKCDKRYLFHPEHAFTPFDAELVK